jgi:hypothetical protein
MNIKALSKIEKGYVKYDWLEVINKIKFTYEDLENITDMIDMFKDNKSAKELVICRYKHLSAYVTIEKADYIKLLDWLYNKFIQLEIYESCERILFIKKHIEKK